MIAAAHKEKADKQGGDWGAMKQQHSNSPCQGTTHTSSLLSNMGFIHKLHSHCSTYALQLLAIATTQVTNQKNRDFWRHQCECKKLLGHKHLLLKEGGLTF